jgi:hypothetical protein
MYGLNRIARGIRLQCDAPSPPLLQLLAVHIFRFFRHGVAAISLYFVRSGIGVQFRYLPCVQLIDGPDICFNRRWWWWQRW